MQKISQGSFGAQQLIATNATFASSVYAVDIDSDGDKDVVSAIFGGGGKLVWYENTNGSGNFNVTHIIDATNVQGCDKAVASDLDGDGDFDVISISRMGAQDTLAWYENTNGNFSSQKIISRDFNQVVGLSSSDIDADGDMDILTVSHLSGMISWFRNSDSNGNFDPIINITKNIPLLKDTHFTDIDNDGDLDILTHAHDKRIVWLERIDGSYEFKNQRLIDGYCDVTATHPADIDGGWGYRCFGKYPLQQSFMV